MEATGASVSNRIVSTPVVHVRTSSLVGAQDSVAPSKAPSHTSGVPSGAVPSTGQSRVSRGSGSHSQSRRSMTPSTVTLQSRESITLSAPSLPDVKNLPPVGMRPKSRLVASARHHSVSKARQPVGAPTQSTGMPSTLAAALIAKEVGRTANQPVEQVSRTEQLLRMEKERKQGLKLDEHVSVVHLHLPRTEASGVSRDRNGTSKSMGRNRSEPSLPTSRSLKAEDGARTGRSSVSHFSYSAQEARNFNSWITSYTRQPVEINKDMEKSLMKAYLGPWGAAHTDRSASSRSRASSASSLMSGVSVGGAGEAARDGIQLPLGLAVALQPLPSREAILQRAKERDMYLSESKANQGRDVENGFTARPDNIARTRRKAALRTCRTTSRLRHARQLQRKGRSDLAPVPAITREVEKYRSIEGNTARAAALETLKTTLRSAPVASATQTSAEEMRKTRDGASSQPNGEASPRLIQSYPFASSVGRLEAASAWDRGDKCLVTVPFESHLGFETPRSPVVQEPQSLEEPEQGGRRPLRPGGDATPRGARKPWEEPVWEPAQRSANANAHGPGQESVLDRAALEFSFMRGGVDAQPTRGAGVVSHTAGTGKQADSAYDSVLRSGPLSHVDPGDPRDVPKSRTCRRSQPLRLESKRPFKNLSVGVHEAQEDHLWHDMFDDDEVTGASTFQSDFLHLGDGYRSGAHFSPVKDMAKVDPGFYSSNMRFARRKHDMYELHEQQAFQAEVNRSVREQNTHSASAWTGKPTPTRSGLK